MRRHAPLALMLAVVLGLAGCGDDTVPAGTTGATTPAGTALQLTHWPDGTDTASGAQPRRLTVNCPPDPADPGCRELVELGTDPFAEPPADQVCTEIYGGPDVLQVDGLIAGRPVSATFTRTDGCEIARWDAIAPLLLRLGTPVG